MYCTAGVYGETDLKKIAFRPFTIDLYLFIAMARIHIRFVRTTKSVFVENIRVSRDTTPLKYFDSYATSFRHANKIP